MISWGKTLSQQQINPSQIKTVTTASDGQIKHQENAINV